MRVLFGMVFAYFLICVTKAYGQANGAPATPPPSVGAVTIIPGRIDFYPGTANTVNMSFDSAFRMAIHLKQGQIVHLATLVTLKKGKTIGELLYEGQGPNNRICHDHTPKLESDTATLPIADVDFTAGDFKPGRHYKLVLFEGADKEIFSMDEDNKLMDYYYTAVRHGDQGVTFDSAKAAYSRIDTKQNNNLGFSDLDDFQDGYDYYKTAIYPTHQLYYALRPSVDNNADITAIVSFNNLTAVVDCLETLYETLKGSNPSCKNGVGSPCDSTCRALSILYALDLLSQDEQSFSEFEAGRISVEDTLKSPVDVKRASTLQAELNNVAVSLRDLTLVQSVLFGYGLVSGNSSCLDDFLERMIRGLARKSADLTTLLKFKQSILSKLNSGDIHFESVDVEDMNSDIFNFQTRTNLYFTPVFGYAVYKFGVTYDFSPYLGFQINLEPMNQNVNFSDIRYKTLWQRLTFVTAWTLKSVAYPEKREDFFGNSSSLLTGIGFKLSHFVMLNASALWFKALDPNPYSTQKNIVCVPALSLSINLSVPTILNGFSSLIPSL